MTKPLRLGIFGANGRMGQAVQAELSKNAALSHRWQVVARVTREDTFPVEAPEVWIDFSVATAATRILEQARKTKTPLLIGTTGLSAECEAAISEVSQQIPILYAANTSLGLNVLLSLVSIAARSLGIGTDVEIHETHHRLKQDLPSGTAISIAKAIAQARGQSWSQVMELRSSNQLRTEGSIGVSASRAGTIPSEHRVLFALEDEVLELKHNTFNRSIYAKGALVGAEWLVQQKPGLYTMQEALGL